MEQVFHDPVNLVFIGLISSIFILWTAQTSIYYRNSRKKIRALHEIFRKFGEDQASKKEQAWIGPVAVNEPTLRVWMERLFFLKKDEHGIWARRHPYLPSKVMLRIPAEQLGELLPAHIQTRMPSLLTAIGVFGTFLGITLGLMKLGHAHTSEALQQGAEALIGGMRTAFVSSLFGLGCAAVAMAIIMRREQMLHREKETAIQTLSEIGEDPTPGDLLLLLQSPQRQEAERSLVQAAKIMSAAAQSLVRAAQGFSAEAVADAVAATLREALEQKMLPVFESMRTSLASIQERMEKQNEEILRDMIHSLRVDVIEPMHQRIVESVESTRDVAKAVEELRERIEHVSEEMAFAAREMRACGEDLADQSRKMAASRHALEEVREAIQAVSAGALDRAERIADTLSHAIQELEIAQDKVLTEIIKAHEKYLQQIEERQRGFFAKVDETLAGAVNRLGEGIMEMTRQVADSLTEAGAVMEEVRSAIREENQKENLRDHS